MTLRRQSGLVGTDTYADEILTLTNKGLRSHRVWAVGLHDPQRSRRGWLVRPGRYDASLTPAEHALARDQLLGLDRGAQRLLEKLADGFVERRQFHGTNLWAQPLRTTETALALKEFHTRLLEQKILVATEIPDYGDRDAGLCDGYDTLSRLHRDGAIVSTFITDRHGPFAERHGSTAQRVHEAAALISLLTAEVEDFWKIRDDRPACYGLRTASRRVTCHPLPLLGPTTPADVLTQAWAATEAVLAGGATRTIETTSETPPDLTIYLMYSVPFWTRDPRWPAFIRAIEQRLEQKVRQPGSPHRALSAHFVSGNGAPDYEDPRARYRVGVSMFVPLVGMPTALAQYSGDRRPADRPQSGSDQPPLNRPAA